MSELSGRAGYQLSEEIGRGAMGIVFRAKDTVLGRELAIKIPRTELAYDTESVRRFVEEAQFTGQLQHPGIPPVFDIGQLSDGRPFLAMKLIKGRTLAALLEEQSDPAADRGRFVAVFEYVCQAVAYAHARGVVHRDLEPSNVMLGSFGEVQVIDWGLAKVLASRVSDDPGLDGNPGVDTPGSPGSDGTAAGPVLGTPAYMSPEQARGENDRHDTRTDVFGLGALLCHILTGGPPYRGSSADEATRQAAAADLADAFARLDACDVEGDLIALCKRCLSPNSADRPADGGELARALAEYRVAAEDRAREAEWRRREEERRHGKPGGWC
jgi:serine/threonine protein kinase